MAINTDYNNKDMFISGQLRDTTDVVKEDTLGKDAFLTMMVAQLKNQDPLSPMEGTDFTAQLAQFSSLEQQITMNTSLTSILNSLNESSESSNIFDFIGKEIQSDGNPVTVDNGEIISGGIFELDEPATINVVIYDSNGTAIRQMHSGNELIDEGTYNIEWDGRDDEGYKVLDGEYTYRVVALNEQGEYTSPSTTTSGLVSGITSYYGKNYLMVDGRRVDPSSVETISLPDENL
ncbi:MAG: hypothetical protein KKD44_01475 [Proteobacteria bacterium]|nr:hypothetical protein [Pseudomonadota bacterium]